MAKRLKTITTNTTGPKPKHDWKSWLNGSPWLLEQGVDYDCKDASMKYQVYREAKKRGLKVTISQRENGLAIQATKPKKGVAK